MAHEARPDPYDRMQRIIEDVNRRVDPLEGLQPFQGVLVARPEESGRSVERARLEL